MTSSNHREDDQEMSMDEILASIRRYVSSEEPADKQQVKSAPSGSGDPFRANVSRDNVVKDNTERDAGFSATDFDDDSTYDDMYPTPPIVTNDRDVRGHSPVSASHDDVVRLADEAPRSFPRHEDVSAMQGATPFVPAHHFTNAVPPMAASAAGSSVMSQAAPVMPSMPFSGSTVGSASTMSPRSYASELHLSQQTSHQLVSPDMRTGSRIDTLISDETLSATMESFSRLRDASTQAAMPTSSATDNLGGLSNQTLDQLFATLARPMIRDWLDRNLPTMVEKMVAKEIERMTRLSR